MNLQDLTDAADDNMALFQLRYRSWFAQWGREQHARWLADRHARFGKPKKMRRGSKPPPGEIDPPEVEPEG